MINTPVAAPTSRLGNGSQRDIPGWAWSSITLGYGNGENWWRDVCGRLRMAGHDGWLSKEHEDVMQSQADSVRKSIESLRNVMPREAGDYGPHQF